MSPQNHTNASYKSILNEELVIMDPNIFMYAIIYVWITSWWKYFYTAPSFKYGTWTISVLLVLSQGNLWWIRLTKGQWFETSVFPLFQLKQAIERKTWVAVDLRLLHTHVTWIECFSMVPAEILSWMLSIIACRGPIRRIIFLSRGSI